MTSSIWKNQSLHGVNACQSAPYMHHILREILCAFGDLMQLEESTHRDSLTAIVSHHNNQWNVALGCRLRRLPLWSLKSVNFSFLVFSMNYCFMSHTRVTLCLHQTWCLAFCQTWHAANPCLSAWLTSCSRCIAESDILVLVMQAICWEVCGKSGCILWRLYEGTFEAVWARSKMGPRAHWIWWIKLMTAVAARKAFW